MPQLTFATGKAELAARGFDTLSDARLGYFFNQGRAELDNLFLWPYRLTTAAGVSPLSIPDLGIVEEVADTSQSGSPPLAYADRRTLRDWYGDVTVTGTPCWFYVDQGAVHTYPVGGSLSVRYYRRCPDLVNAGDAPLAPADYHLLYVDFAARWAQKDGQQPDGLSADIVRQLQGMVSDLLGGQQIVGSDLVPDTGESVDG